MVLVCLTRGERFGWFVCTSNRKKASRRVTDNRHRVSAEVRLLHAYMRASEKTVERTCVALIQNMNEQ